MPKRVGLTFERWPAEDRRAWQSATSADDYFAEDARFAHWRPKTRYQAMTAYGRWLAFLAEHSPATLREPAAARASPALVQRYVELLQERISAAGVVAELNHLRHALRAIAPALDQRCLQKLQQDFARQIRPRDVRDRIVDPRRLFALGLTLMSDARGGEDRLRSARDYRDGLLIALLAARPLRRRNIAALEFGKEVVQHGVGWSLILDRTATKTGEPLEFSLPSELVPYVNEYRDVFRTRFPGADQHRGLWPSTKGGRLGEDAIYDLVCRRTREAFGLPVYPHLFRSIAATALARDTPDQILIARDLLGHARVDTTCKHYRRSKSIAASRRHAAVIAAMRKG
jgi:integrase